MNVVRQKPYLGLPLGDFDPSGGIMADVQWGPEEIPAQPDYGSTSTHGFPDYGGPDLAPAPSTTVPKPQPGASTGILSPYQTWGSIYNAPNVVPTAGSTLPPGPSPRVNVPLSSPGGFAMWFQNSTLISGIPNWLAIGGGLFAVSMLGNVVGGKGRRR